MSDLNSIENMIADYRQTRAKGLLVAIGAAVVNTDGYLMFITEPTSFTEIFAVARTHGLTLNPFSQGRRETDYFGNWRCGDECFDIGRHERPFDALLIALKHAVAAVDAKEDFAPARVKVAETVLPPQAIDAEAKFPEPVVDTNIFD